MDICKEFLGENCLKWKPELVLKLIDTALTFLK